MLSGGSSCGARTFLDPTGTVVAATARLHTRKHNDVLLDFQLVLFCDYLI